MASPPTDEAKIESDHRLSRRCAVFRPPVPRRMVSFHEATVEAAFAVRSRHFDGNLARFLHGIGWTADEWVDWHHVIGMIRRNDSWEDIARCDTMAMRRALAPYTSGAMHAPPVPRATGSFHDATIETFNMVVSACFEGDRARFLKCIRKSVYDYTNWHLAIRLGLESADAEELARTYTRDMRARLAPFMSEARSRLELSNEPADPRPRSARPAAGADRLPRHARQAVP